MTTTLREAWMHGADASWESFQRSVKRSRVIETRDSDSFPSHFCCRCKPMLLYCSSLLHCQRSMPSFFSDEMIFWKNISPPFEIGPNKYLSSMHVYRMLARRTGGTRTCVVCYHLSHTHGSSLWLRFLWTHAALGVYFVGFPMKTGTDNIQLGRTPVGK